MSIRIMSAIFESKTLGPTERLVMLALADHADDDGRCYPSIERLRQRTGLSERAVQTNIRKLVDQGYIRIVPGGGKGNANLYFVSANPAAAAPYSDPNPAADAPRRKCTPAADAPQTPQEMRANPAADAPEPSGTIIEPSTTAREASKSVVVDDQIIRRDQVLSLMGLDGVIRPDGKTTGMTNDMSEIPKWDALGLTRQEQDAKIREMLDKQRAKAPGFFPSTWRWFTAGLTDLAAAKRANPSSAKPAAQPIQFASPEEAAEHKAILEEISSLRGSNSDRAFHRRGELIARGQQLIANQQRKYGGPR